MIFLIVCLVIFELNQILQYAGLANSFMTCYLDDLLFFPIVLSFYRVCIQVVENQPNYKIPLYYALIGWALISVLFEFAIPKVDNRFTADLWDVLFYGLGIALYYISRSKMIVNQF